MGFYHSCKKIGREMRENIFGREDMVIGTRHHQQTLRMKEERLGIFFDFSSTNSTLTITCSNETECDIGQNIKRGGPLEYTNH